MAKRSNESNIDMKEVEAVIVDYETLPQMKNRQEHAKINASNLTSTLIPSKDGTFQEKDFSGVSAGYRNSYNYVSNTKMIGNTV